MQRSSAERATGSVGVAQTEQRVVLELLARWARFLSFEQVAALLADKGDPKRSAQRLIANLERQGLVTRRTLLARPPVAARPLATFTLGGTPPDSTSLSAACRARWQGPAQAIHIIQLTATGAKALGAPRPRTIRASEATHDLQMAEVALFYFRSGTVRTWQRDDALALAKRWGNTVPDAEVLLKSGERLVIECGGTYSAQKLRAFHDAVSSKMGELGAHAYSVF